MTTPELEKLIEQYHQEFSVDVEINMMNLRDKLMISSAMQHKWIGRLIRLKKQRSNYENQRDRDSHIMMQKLKTGARDMKLSDRFLLTQVENTQQIRDITAIIQNYDLVIEYLERMDKVFTQGGHTMRNLVELIKLETT